MQTITISLNRLRTVRLEIILPVVIFAIPFIVSGPQLLTGTIVNCLLFLIADRLANKKLFIIAALPSLGAISHGVLFGPYTLYLFYLLPFICFSNVVLMLSYNWLKTKTTPLIAVVASSTSKTILLLSFASILVTLNIVPNIFLTSMGLTQLATSILGGSLAIIINRLNNK